MATPTTNTRMMPTPSRSIFTISITVDIYHIYILLAGLVNLDLGTRLRARPPDWRGGHLQAGEGQLCSPPTDITGRLGCIPTESPRGGARSIRSSSGRAGSPSAGNRILHKGPGQAGVRL